MAAVTSRENHLFMITCGSVLVSLSIFPVSTLSSVSSYLQRRSYCAIIWMSDLPLFPSFFTNINQWNTKFYSTFFFIMPMYHLQNNRAHTLSAACTFTKITKIEKLIYYTYRYVLLFFNMSRTIAVFNFGPGIFTYKLTYFVFLVPLLL